MDAYLKAALFFHFVVSSLTAVVAFLNMKTLRDLIDLVAEIRRHQDRVVPPPDAEALLMERLNSMVGKSYAARR